MVKHHIKNYEFFVKNYAELPDDIQKSILKNPLPSSMLKCICEICYNIQKKNITITPEQKRQLEAYKTSIRLLSSHSASSLKKRRRLKLKGRGFLPILFSIVAPIISSIVSSMRK